MEIQHEIRDRITEIIDRVKTDDRPLDTTEYAAAIEQIMADAILADRDRRPATLPDLPADAADGKIIIQLAGRTVHWPAGPNVLANLLQTLIAGLGPAQEGA